MNPKYKLHTFSSSRNNEAQLQAIYDLNQANTPEVGSLESMQHLKQLIEFSSYNLLVLKEDEIVGFIICMREGAAYGSENYKFFTKRLKKFLYVDRVQLMSNTEGQVWDKLYMKTYFLKLIMKVCL